MHRRHGPRRAEGVDRPAHAERGLQERRAGGHGGINRRAARGDQGSQCARRGPGPHGGPLGGDGGPAHPHGGAHRRHDRIASRHRLLRGSGGRGDRGPKTARLRAGEGAHAHRRHRDDLRIAAERDGGRGGPLREIGERRHPSGRKRGHGVQPRAGAVHQGRPGEGRHGRERGAVRGASRVRGDRPFGVADGPRGPRGAPGRGGAHPQGGGEGHRARDQALQGRLPHLRR